MGANVKMVQLQIKAFNKALSRADKADLISDEIYAAISDLIDPERMTAGGYGKAGIKYLENMTPEELLAYSSDIEQAKNLLELEKLSYTLDISEATDSKALLWKMFQKLQDSGYAFDSEQVRAVADGETNISYKQMAIQMNKYLHEEDYGLSDFTECFNKQNSMT